MRTQASERVAVEVAAWLFECSKAGHAAFARLWRCRTCQVPATHETLWSGRDERLL